MNCAELKQKIDAAPATSRVVLEKLFLYVTVGGEILPDYADYLEASSTYSEFFDAIYQDASLKDTLLWAECAKYKRRNWLHFFEPKMLIQNIRMKTDGLPILFGSGVMLAPTGGRDNIANFYLFERKGFNTSAAEFVTSIGGTFTLLDHEFCGIYGLYKYRGNVILEEWDVEREAVEVDPT